MKYNDSISGTPDELFDLGLLPYDTEEWDEYELNPLIISSFEPVWVNSSGYEVKLRSDYYYPNEWDSPLNKFALHDDRDIQPAFFTYNATDDNPKQKPTTMSLTNVRGYHWSIWQEREEEISNGLLDVSYSDPKSDFSILHYSCLIFCPVFLIPLDS